MTSQLLLPINYYHHYKERIAKEKERAELLAKLAQEEINKRETEEFIEHQRRECEAAILRLQQEAARKEAELIARLDKEKLLELGKLEKERKKKEEGNKILNTNTNTCTNTNTNTNR